MDHAGAAERAVDSYRDGIVSKDLPTERERLVLLERDCDPHTIEILAGLPVQASWRCVDLGAGAGSIAYWLADRCHAGHVIAADADVRFLDCARGQRLEIRQFDVGRDEFPDGSLDLVHARSLLCHVPNRDTVVAKAVRWLAPGGWLVVGEPYMFPASPSPYRALRQFYGAVDRRWKAQGSDMHWARRLPGLMTQAGLCQLNMVTRANCMGLGGAHDAFALASIRQIGEVMVRDGDISSADLERMLALFGDPTFVDLRSVFLTVWGQKPLE